MTPDNKQPPVTGSTWADLGKVIHSVEWAWPGWLPGGILTVLAGAQETGKSILSLKIGACFLVRSNWPDGTPFGGNTGNILWVETESAQAVNIARAEAWGLPTDKILSPLDGPEDVRLDNLNHQAAVIAMAQRQDVQIIIVDSLSGGHLRSENESNQMMGVIKWLASLARDTGKPILLTHHLRKRTVLDTGDGLSLDRVRGSGAITQTARVVWALDVPNPTNPNNRRLSVLKNNLAPKVDPLGFSINDDGVSFGDAPTPPQTTTLKEQAIDLLPKLLADGPKPSTWLMNRVEQEGLSWDAAKRAKATLGISSKKDGDGWLWSLPTDDTQN